MTHPKLARRARNAALFAALATAASAMIGIETATAAILPLPLKAAQVTRSSSIQLADARSYRHCHNVRRRVYCHKREHLPMNWPPFSGEKKPACEHKAVSMNTTETPTSPLLTKSCNVA